MRKKDVERFFNKKVNLAVQHRHIDGKLFYLTGKISNLTEEMLTLQTDKALYNYSLDEIKLIELE